MEIIIGTDAYDEGTCLLQRRDCWEAGPLTWKSFYEQGEGTCPCSKCKLFAEFKRVNLPLVKFREWVSDYRCRQTIEDFCEDIVKSKS